MFTLNWRNHSAADRGKAGGPTAAPRGRCQRCGQINLRYVHLMESPGFPDRIEVGCECAQVLCPTYDAVRAERRLKTRDLRLRHWLSLPWLSIIGNQYLNHAGFNWGVIRVDGGWGWWIKGAVDICSKIAYATYAEARVTLFDYVDARNMRGGLPPCVQPVSLITSLHDIENVCARWANSFTWRSHEYYRMDCFMLLGKVGCAIYINGRSAPFWELQLSLPDDEEGSRTYYGPKRACQAAVEAKIAALDIFRKEMVRIAYERAGVELQPLPLPTNEIERWQIADAHLCAENERDARRAIEQRASEEREKQRQLDGRRRAEAADQQRQQEQAEREHAAQQAALRQREAAAQEIEQRQLAQEELQRFRQHLQRFPKPADILKTAIDFALLNWQDRFHCVENTGNYTARFKVEDEAVRCTVFRKDGEWRIGVFTPFNLVCSWHNAGYSRAEKALDAARQVFRDKMTQWAGKVLQWSPPKSSV